jgi:hypothetical protein
MRRRMADVAASGDAGPWEELIARALAAPPPYRPVPGVRFTIFAPVSGLSRAPDTTYPGRCTSWSPPCLPSAGRHLEPVTSQPARAAPSRRLQVRGGPGLRLPQEPPVRRAEGRSLFGRSSVPERPVCRAGQSQLCPRSQPGARSGMMRRRWRAPARRASRRYLHRFSTRTAPLLHTCRFAYARWILCRGPGARGSGGSREDQRNAAAGIPRANLRS